MKTIRSGVFETNSSSSHSLVIRTNAILKDLKEDVYFTHKEMLESLDRVSPAGRYLYWNKNWYFGRHPFRVLSTFQEKWQYAYANACYDEKEKKALFNLLKKLVPEVKFFKEPEDLGVDEDFLFCWLNKLGISMEEFLTNRKYVVICDGDEYNIWRHLNKNGIIDKFAIEQNVNFVDYDYDDEDF